MTATSRRSLMAAGGAALLSAPFVRQVRAAGPGMKLGCLTDINGPYSDVTGKGSIGSIQLAIEDFHKLHPDIAVELVSADYGMKPDTGLGIVRSWFDSDGVDAVIDIPTSAMALAAISIVQQKNKVALVSSAATSDLTAGSCGPNHVHFATDTYALSVSLVHDIVKQGGTSWFFIVPNYELGKAALKDASGALKASGGTVAGALTYAFPGTTDYSSLLLQAQASGAKVLCFLNGGDDLTNSVKQANEFGIARGGMIIAPTFLGEYTIASVGLEVMGGYYFNSPFYWDYNDDTRAFAARLQKLVPTSIPFKNNACSYSAALHYLKTAATMGTAAAKADGRATVQAMKAMPIQDTVFGKSYIRQDGQVIRDMMLVQVKKPAESKSKMDMCKIVAVTPGEQSARPLHEGGCKLV